MKHVGVIGGSRYFGRHVVLRLRDAGARVTVVNRGSSAPPPGVDHVIADRDDERALGAALGNRTFDAVIDQVCNTPRQAAAARRVFDDRTPRYVMTSTIEVYDPASSDAIHPTPPGGGVPEDAIDTTHWPVRPDLPWHEGEFRNRHYAEGKRQAEAEFARDPAFPFVAVRSGHVLGGGDADFTGRLRHYVERVRTGRPVDIHRVNHPSSFIGEHEIADFLIWAAGADFLGPVNARSHGELDVTDLCARIAEHGSRPPVYRTVEPGAEASPFAFDRYYGMDNSRAERLGFRFSDTADWLSRAVSEQITALKR